MDLPHKGPVMPKVFLGLVIEWVHVDGLVQQERRNSIANALELRISCTNPSVDG